MKKFLLNAVVFLIGAASVFAQENSPYTRYGLGDPVPNVNVIGRAMGGISAAYFDYSSINAVNPATYSFSRLSGEKKGQGGMVGLDFGVDIVTRRTLENTTGKKFKSNNGVINYMNIAVPIKKNWAMNIGFAPETRINYKISISDRLPGIDSIRTIYTGEGGAYKAFIGSGWKFKNFGIGINVGYLFGTRDADTKRFLLNDSVVYKASDYNTHTSFGNAYVTLGLYHSFLLSEKEIQNAKKQKYKQRTMLRVGAYGTMQPVLKGSQDLRRESFFYTSTGGQVSDTVSFQQNIRGDIKYPATLGFGVILDRETKWMLGADFVTTNWSTYRFYGQPDVTGDAWQFKLGGQLFTGNGTEKSFLRRMIYRAGLNVGTEPYRFNGNQLKQISGSLGFGIPLRTWGYNRQGTVINAAFEFGSRGTRADILKENFFKIGIGVSFSDWWFNRAKYY
jgi:hypothetical protein